MYEDRLNEFDKHIERTNTGSCKWDSAPKSVIDSGFVPLSVADMEFAIPLPIKRALQKALDHSICGYTYADSEYRAAVCKYIQRRHDFCVAPEALLCTNGVVPALGIAIRAFTDVGDKVLFQPPVYPPFLRAIQNNGRIPIENPLVVRNNHYEMDFEGLASILRAQKPKLMLLCSPHNPTGRVWTYDELKYLGGLCKEYGAIIVSDEIHSDIVYSGKHTVLSTVEGLRDISIICTAMSKTFNLAGMMCSNIFVENKELRDVLSQQIVTDASDCIPYFARAASIAAFAECDDWIDALINYLRTNLDFCYRFIDENLPMLKYSHAEGTYLLWLDFSELHMSRPQLTEFLIKAGICAVAGEDFGTGGEHFVRINVAVPRKVISDAMYRLAKAIMH